MKKKHILSLAVFFIAIYMLSCASTPTAPVDTRPSVTVYSWPFWVEYPVDSGDYERIWKVVLDVVSENWTIDVVDKESGYIQTTRVGYYNYNYDIIYTIKIFPDRKLVKIGATLLYKNSTSQLNLPTQMITSEGHGYDVGHEIQDRLRVIR